MKLHYSCSVICLYRSATAVQPWLHLHSSFSHLSTSLSTHPYNSCILHIEKNRRHSPSRNAHLCFTELPKLDMSMLSCSRLRSFTLTPEPIFQPAPNTSDPSLRAIPHAICYWRQGPYRCGSRMHSNVDLHLFTPGISDPWEAFCAPLILVLIYLVIWGLLCCREAESSISCLLSCLMLASVSRGERWVGRWGKRILGLNPFSARLKSTKGWYESWWIKESSGPECQVLWFPRLCCV